MSRTDVVAMAKKGKDAAPDAKAEALHEPVTGEAAAHGADGHPHEGQDGVDGAGLEVKAASLGEVDVEPAEEDPRNISVGKIAEGQSEDLFAGKDAAPRDAALCGGREYVRGRARLE